MVFYDKEEQHCIRIVSSQGEGASAKLIRDCLQGPAAAAKEANVDTLRLGSKQKQ